MPNTIATPVAGHANIPAKSSAPVLPKQGGAPVTPTAPTAQPVPTVAAGVHKFVPPVEPLTHVRVPIALLQAIHDTLTAHTASIGALLPGAPDPAAAAADLVARTADRLKRQAAAGR